MKHYIAGIVIGLGLIAGGYFFVRSRIYIPADKQEVAATRFQKQALDSERAGDWEKAVKIYRKIVNRCPVSNRAELSLYRIFEIYSRTDKNKMVETADWYLKKYPHVRGSEISTRVGEYFLYEKQDLGRAEKLYLHSINLASSMQWAVKAQERLSEIYFRKKKYAKTIELNNKLISSFGERINPDYYHLLNLKAYWRLGKQKEAYGEAKKIKNAKQPVVANEILYWKVLEKFEPKNAPALMHLGDAYLRMGFRNIAAGYWKRAAKLEPKNKLIWKKLNSFKAHK